MTRSKMVRWTLLCGIVCASGCGTHIVFERHGTPVRLLETVSNVKVLAPDKDGLYTIPGKADLSKGGYYLPKDPGE